MLNSSVESVKTPILLEDSLVFSQLDYNGVANECKKRITELHDKISILNSDKEVIATQKVNTRLKPAFILSQVSLSFYHSSILALR